MIRAFVAIPLPEAATDRLASLMLMLPLPRRLPPENLHLTLAFLGDVPEPLLEDIHYALEALRLPRFQLSLREVGLFGGDKPRVVYAAVAPDPALERLHRKVAAALRQAGARVEARQFVPHITLARLRPYEADMVSLEHALLASAGFRAGPYEVDHFVLHRSHLGQKGAHYEELARYALA